MKYVLKKVLIGVLLFLIIGFLKSVNVFALTIGNTGSSWKYLATFSVCNTNNDDLICSSEYDSYITEYPQTNVLPANNIIKNIAIRFQNFEVDNRNDSSTYYNHIVDPYNSNYRWIFSYYADYNGDWQYQFTFKNINVIACNYLDINNEVQDCVDNIIYASPLLFMRTYSSGSYPYYNDMYFRFDPNTYYKNITIKFGGIGSPSGNWHNLYSGVDNVNINSTYMDYNLVNNVSFSTNRQLEFTFENFGPDIYTKLYNRNNYSTYLPYQLGQTYYNNYGVQSKLVQISNNVILSQQAQAITQQELAQAQMINNDLIDYNADYEDNNNTEFANNLKNTFGGLLGNGPTLFQSFLSLPIELLRENSRYEVMSQTAGGVGTTCTSYNSAFINDLNVSGSLNLSLPFVNQSFNLTCKDVDIINTVSGHIGSEYYGQIFSGMYHVILTGLLSYWVIIAYFKLIKEIYDPDNNSIEVMDL